MKGTDRSGPLQGARREPASGGEEGVLLLRVVKGDPSAEELAALTVVVAAMSRRPERRRVVPVGGWSDPVAGHCRPLRPGPGGWLAAGWPS